MFTEYFARAEASYRQQRFRQEADEYRLARLAARCTRRWPARLRRGRAADVTSRGGAAARRPATSAC